MTGEQVTVFDHDGTRHPAVIVGWQSTDPIVSLTDQDGRQVVWPIGWVQMSGDTRPPQEAA